MRAMRGTLHCCECDMTNFVIGAVVGFLICVWALQTAPSVAFSALWGRLEQVQEMSAAASQAYDALHPKQQTVAPVTMTAPPPVEAAAYR
jgi:hypothetical protein